jgi:site-specific DNA recombinase
VLVRDWGGATHQAKVLEDGILFRSKRYKSLSEVNRLTRSLADFAKMVEVFDAHGVSFVAVTQQFNTTTSMGRLTLNVLLSFAPFEREVTGERIRDKIAASKRKGMWMGGVVPLGHDVRDRRIAIDEREAETVRDIFRRYLGAHRQLHKRRARQRRQELLDLRAGRGGKLSQQQIRLRAEGVHRV